jgi:hypothetical protein
MSKEQIANKYNLKINNHNDEMVINAMFAIKKHNMDTWIREFNESSGFMLSMHDNIYILSHELQDDDHSGCSFACTLRVCQSLLTTEYNNELIVEDIENENNETPETNNLEPINTKIVTEDIDTEAIKGSGKVYNLYNKMDEHNKKAMDVAVSHRIDSAVDYMTKGIRDGTMDYGTMRSLYG